MKSKNKCPISKELADSYRSAKNNLDYHLSNQIFAPGSSDTAEKIAFYKDQVIKLSQTIISSGETAYTRAITLSNEINPRILREITDLATKHKLPSIENAFITAFFIEQDTYNAIIGQLISSQIPLTMVQTLEIPLFPALDSNFHSLLTPPPS